MKGCGYMKLAFAPAKSDKVVSKMCMCKCVNTYASTPGRKIVHRS